MLVIMQKKNQQFHVAKTSNDEIKLLAENDEPLDEKIKAFIHCSVIYIISKIRKIGRPTEDFSIEIEGEKTEEGVWKKLHISYNVKGRIRKDISWKGCHQSIEKYCPLLGTMRKTGAKISWEIKLV